MHGRWFCSAISCARRCFFTVSGKYDPPLTVASFATITHSRPSTTPMPVTMPAAGACPSYMSQAARAFSSRNAPPGSTRRSMRSRAVSFPRERCRSVAFSPPPRATAAERSRTSATSVSMRSRRRPKTSSRSTPDSRTAIHRSLQSVRVPDEKLLEKYADLVVRVGANVQEGQDVVVFALVEHAPFARALVRAAYGAGARYAIAAYGDQYVKRELIAHGSDETLEWSPPWELERLNHLSRVGGSMITITGDPNPDLFADLDGARVGKARAKEYGERSLQIVFEEKSVNWTIAGYPTERWAERIYGSPDVDRLLRDVGHAVRLDESDPVRAWREHVERVARHDGRLDLRLAHPLHDHRRLEQVGAELREDAPLRHLAHAVARAPDPLQPRGHRLRR